jgi:hypothetical protein
VQKPTGVSNAEKEKAQAEAARESKLIDGLVGAAPSSIAPYLEKIAPCVKATISVGKAAWPHICQAVSFIHWFYNYIPNDLLWALIGFCLCFFGGLYPTTFACMEAFRLCGWERTQGAIEDLYDESTNILKQLKEDDEKDEDGDGVRDVDTLSAQSLLMRKTQVVMTKCDPNKIDVALSGFYTSWLGVVATLKI